jgi:hypothetical protein
MSFNVNTRLNNLQQQINAITNEGLTNPLQGVMDVNGKGLTNVNIIDGGNYTIELKTNNVGGIVLDNPLYTTSDITVNTLHYTALDPPINYNSVSYTLIGAHTVEPTEGNINMYNDNPNSGFISVQSLVSPSLSCSIIMVSPSGSNSIKIGFSTSSTATTPDYGVYWYPEDQDIQSIGGSGQIPYLLTTLNLDLLVVGNKLKFYINSVEQPTLEITIPNVPYYLNCYAYVGTEIQVQNIGFVINHAQTLSDVLATGNDGGGQNITGVGALTCGTLNYTTLNPPIPTTPTPSISQVLTAGSIATNQDLSGINNLTCTTLKYTSLSPVPQSQWVGTATSNLDMGTYQINNSNQISVVQSPNVYTAIQSNSGNGLKITSATFATQTGVVYDTYYNKLPPSQWVGTATSTLDMGQYAITNAESITLPNNELLSINTQLTLTKDGLITSGAIYDSYYNKPTLTNILSGGSDAGNQDITNVKDLTVSQLNYTTLNPPIPTATTPTLTQVLTAGAGAGNQDITGVKNLFTSDLILNYGSAGSNFQIFGNSDQLVFQQYKGSPLVLTNQPIIITDNDNILFNTASLILKDSYVIDSKYNTPSYKRILGNQAIKITSFLNMWGTFFSTSLYPKTISNVYYGVNYAELSMSSVSITLKSNLTFNSVNTISVFLSNSPSADYDLRYSNRIIQTAVQGANTINFTSTATTTLYWYNSAPITNLYLNMRVSASGMQPLNLQAFGTISGMLTGSVCSDASPLTLEE